MSELRLDDSLASPPLVEPAPLGGLDRGGEQPRTVLALDKAQRTVIVFVLAAMATAVVVPYPVTKIVLGAALALFWARLLLGFDERFVGMYVLLLPTFQLLPLEALGVPGLNWQTVFLIIFIVAAASGESPASGVAVSGWVIYFSVVLILAAVHAILTVQQPLWPLFMGVKNWLFPFALFFLGWRTIRTRQQLWFLVLCVAIVSFALSLHGLRDGLTTGNLMTNRPVGLLTGQANLFAGFLAMHALLCLFVSRTAELGRTERWFLAGAAFVMIMTLVFTLSRGAWIAFVVTAAVVGFATNRGLVVLLVCAFLVGYRWAPEEAVTRADLTLTAVEQSRDSSLEESLDESAALRIIQWKTFPELFFDSPIWGTGLDTYAERLGQLTRIFRPAHATMVQIGTEMGVFGLLGYLGLLGSAAFCCASRARRGSPGSFQRALGLGLLAATVCLFLLDFSGGRFKAHTVTSYFWLLLGAYLGTTNSEDGAPARDTTREGPG
jgi:O-antigen ligase